MLNTRQIAVFLLSVTLIALELIWTRLFSAELYYSFAFLVLSLAILGLGLGALALRLIPRLGGEGGLGTALSLTGLAALAGPPLVFRLDLDLSRIFADWAVVGRLLGAVCLLTLAFFFGGLALAILFRRHHQEIDRLYMADLVGAGLGVPTAVLLMNGVGTPEATFLCALPVLLAALLTSRRWLRLLPVGLAVAMALLCFRAEALLEQPREERGPVIYKHWDAMAKLKLYGFGRDFRSFNIDNLANTTTYGFDGDWDRPPEERFQFGIDVSYLIERFDSCSFLSLGAGGGADVLQALQAGAGEIHAVEVNPQINRMLTEGDPDGYILPSPEPAWLEARAREEEERLRQEREAAGEVVGEAAAETTPEESATPGEAEEESAEPAVEDRIVTMDEFSGYIYLDPRVRVATEDARAYVGRFRDKFDLIYSLSSNTFAALASGSFALAENYLFTTEAFRDYWLALSEDGFLMMEHQFYMPRLVGALIEALEGLGIEDPGAHFAVYDLPQMRRNVLLLSKQPLTDEVRRNAFGELTQENYEQIHLLYPPPEGLEENLIHRIVRDGWRSASAEAPVDISPTTDDRPFVGQMGLWKNLSRDQAEKLRMLDVFGFPLSKILILTILAVVLLLVVPLNLAPYLGSGERLGTVPWLYFFAIGVGFMAIEVVLIQQYTLFVGPSAYSIAVTLMALLVSSGLGSRFSARFRDRTPFFGIVAWLALDVLLFQTLVAAGKGLSLGPRMLVTALLLAPLGFFLGMPFPKAARRVGPLVDWGFAVNGAASVLGATGVLLVAFRFGYSVSLLAAGGLYVVAFALLAAGRGWGRRSPPFL